MNKRALPNLANTIYVGNINRRAAELDLYNVFSPIGKILRLDLIWHTDGTCGGSHRGYCFIEFSTLEEARTACKKKVKLGGRALKIDSAHGKKERDNAAAAARAQVLSLPNTVAPKEPKKTKTSKKERKEQRIIALKRRLQAAQKAPDRSSTKKKNTAEPPRESSAAAASQVVREAGVAQQSQDAPSRVSRPVKVPKKRAHPYG